MKMVLKSKKKRYWKSDAASFNPILKGKWVRNIQEATVYENPEHGYWEARDIIEGDRFVKIEIQEIQEIQEI